MRQVTPLGSFLLDAIRAVAAYLVVVGHGVGFVYADVLKDPMAPYVQNIAVTVFFIVSGYVIAQQLDKFQQQQRTFGDYFCNRAARVYSGLVPALIFIALADVAAIMAGLAYSHTKALNLHTFVANLFMLQDFPKWARAWSPVTSFGSGRPLWTLAVECWIYLAVGWAVFKRADLSAGHRTAWVVLVLFSIVPFANLYGGRGTGLFLYWLAGALAYWVISRTLADRAEPRLFLAGAVVVGIAALFRLWRANGDGYDPGFALCAALCFGLLMAASSLASGTQPRGRAIASYFAGASYTLYLTHYTIHTHLVAAMNAYQWPKAWVLLVALILPVPVALLIASQTERKYRQLADWLLQVFGAQRSASVARPERDVSTRGAS